MTLSGNTSSASPNDPDTQPVDLRKDASALGRELGELCITQQAVLLYNDLKRSNTLTEDLANRVEERATSLCEDIMSTELGRRADETLAATTKSIVDCFVCRQDNEDACHHSIVSQAIMKLFHLCFRFFLPTMLFRWSVDIALVCTEITLAFTKDFVRWEPTTTVTARVPVQGFEASDETTEKEAHGNNAGTVDRVPMPADSSVLSTWWEVVTYFFTLNFYMAKFFAIFIVIPYLSYQWYFLNAISCFMHRLAGMKYEDAPEQEKENNPPGPTMRHGTTPPKERRLRPRQWLVDTVLNRLICQLLETPVVGLFLEMVGIKPQFNLFRRLQKALQGDRRMFGMRGGAGSSRGLLTAMGNFSRFVEGDMASYLYLDYTYNEDDDPDYVPAESSDDSLEYADDLDTTGNDGTGQRNANGHAKNGVKAKRGPTRRKRRNTESQGYYREAQTSDKSTPDDDPPQKAQEQHEEVVLSKETQCEEEAKSEPVDAEVQTQSQENLEKEKGQEVENHEEVALSKEIQCEEEAKSEAVDAEVQTQSQENLEEEKDQEVENREEVALSKETQCEEEAKSEPVDAEVQTQSQENLEKEKGQEVENREEVALSKETQCEEETKCEAVDAEVQTQSQENLEKEKDQVENHEQVALSKETQCEEEAKSEAVDAEVQTQSQENLEEEKDQEVENHEEVALSKEIQCEEKAKSEAVDAEVQIQSQENLEVKPESESIGEAKHAKSVPLSPIKRQQRQAFLSCVEKVINPEFAKKLDESLEWADVNTDGIERATSLLTKIDNEEELLGASADIAISEATARFIESEHGCESPIDQDVMDPDIAALLASNTPLDTVSVRADGFFTSSPAVGVFRTAMDEDDDDEDEDDDDDIEPDPANHPLPPSPAPAVSPLGRARRQSWKSKATTWTGGAVDTIQEEDEARDQEIGACAPDPPCIETSETQNSEKDQVLIVSEEEHKTPEAPVDTEKLDDPENSGTAVNVVTALALSEDIVSATRVTQSKEPEKPESEVFENGQADQDTEDNSRAEEDYSDVHQANGAQQVDLVKPETSTEAVELPEGHSKEKPGDMKAEPAEIPGVASACTNTVPSFSSSCPPIVQILGESVSSPRTSLSSMSSFNENDYKDTSTDRTLPVQSPGGGKDSEKVSKCTDVDTGIASFVQE